MARARRRSPGEGNVGAYQTRTQGTLWYYKATLTQSDGTKKVTRVRGFETKTAALGALAEALNASRTGTYISPSKMSTGQWLDEWLRSHRAEPQSKATYRMLIDVYLKPHIGSIPLADLKSGRIRELYQELEESGARHRRDPSLSASTVRLAHSVLHQALQAAVDDEKLAKNPADPRRSKPPKLKTGAAAIPKCWSAQQLRVFLDWARENDPDRYVLWRLYAMTGARRFEVLELTWADIKSGFVSFRTTKRGKPRSAPLDRETAALLKSRKADRGSINLNLARDDALVFGQISGRPIRPPAVTSWFGRMVAKCRADLGDDTLPAISVHGLRHSFCSINLAVGVSPARIAAITGHTVRQLRARTLTTSPTAPATSARD